MTVARNMKETANRYEETDDPTRQDGTKARPPAPYPLKREG